MKTIRNLVRVCAFCLGATARILGALLVFAILAIAIGEGMPNPFTQSLTVQLGFLALALIVIGILAGWRWELFGGIVATAGWCLFVGSAVGVHKLNLFISLLALPGILYLASARSRRRDNRPTPAVKFAFTRRFHLLEQLRAQISLDNFRALALRAAGGGRRGIISAGRRHNGER